METKTLRWRGDYQAFECRKSSEGSIKTIANTFGLTYYKNIILGYEGQIIMFFDGEDLMIPSEVDNDNIVVDDEDWLVFDVKRGLFSSYYDFDMVLKDFRSDD